ncbi:MAG: alanine racemase [Deferribacteres bacterium]|nr:alanine racemase [candidate division KSB1 bacterium]MCB9502443.1 alanine racemase [Deferribacteres bacterium]
MKFDLSKISQPTLLLDKERVINNIARMREKAQQGNVLFRPHFKTHQSAEIGEWFRQNGTNKITVSSLRMAEYFAKNGWQDITLAFPVNIRAIDKINEIAKRIRLNLLVENVEGVEFLGHNLQTPVSIYIKVDTGLNRTGVWWQNTELVEAIVSICQKSKMLEFAGLLTHSGHSYRIQANINEIYSQTAQRLNELKSAIKKKFNVPCLLSIGDTPCCRTLESFEGIDEIRPGNFVFFDVMQHQLNVCAEEEIAIALACPVVAKHENRQQIVVHGGAVHLSESSMPYKNGSEHFGFIVNLSENDGWGKSMADSYVRAISQEHGIIQAGESLFTQTKVGDLIGILPVHSCLAANLMCEYLSSDGQYIKMLGG